MTNRQPWHREGSERGAISVFTAVFALTGIALLGLVVDGSAHLRAQSRAHAIASQAARAGAQAINPRGQTIQVDPVGARRAANAYLASAGVTGTVTATDQDVTVTVTLTGAYTIPIPGDPGYEVTAHATATPILGTEATGP